MSRSEAVEKIRRRAEERRASGAAGGVREWFEVDTLLARIDELEAARPDGDAVELAARAIHQRRHPGEGWDSLGKIQNLYLRDAESALEVALPGLRRQVMRELVEDTPPIWSETFTATVQKWLASRLRRAS